jgi:hypothetical protein
MLNVICGVLLFLLVVVVITCGCFDKMSASVYEVARYINHKLRPKISILNDDEFTHALIMLLVVIHERTRPEQKEFPALYSDDELAKLQNEWCVNLRKEVLMPSQDQIIEILEILFSMDKKEG